MNVTKCTESLEPSDVSFQSNKDLKIGGDHFTPPPYQTAPSSIPTKLGLIVSYKKEINVEVSSKLTSHCHSLLCSFCRSKTVRRTAVALAITADVLQSRTV